MKKRYMLPIVGALATAGVTYLIKNRNNNNDSFDGAGTVKDSFVQAGLPDQVNKQDYTQLENSKMVDEGSQFGVQYFNESAEKEVEELLDEVSN